MFNDKQLIKLKNNYLITILFFYFDEMLIHQINTLYKKYKNYNIHIKNIKWEEYKGDLNIFCIPAFCFYKEKQEEIIYGDDIDYVEEKIKEFIGGID